MSQISSKQAYKNYMNKKVENVERELTYLELLQTLDYSECLSKAAAAQKKAFSAKSDRSVTQWADEATKWYGYARDIKARIWQRKRYS